jgi:hypothetical protein
MFVLKKQQTFDWPVKVQVPENGRKKKVTFMAQFNVVDSDEQDKLLVNTVPADVMGFLRKALVKTWELSIEDEDGEPIDGDDHETRNEIVLQNPIFAQAVMDAFTEGSRGKAAKNS